MVIQMGYDYNSPNVTQMGQYNAGFFLFWVLQRTFLQTQQVKEKLISSGK